MTGNFTSSVKVGVYMLWPALGYVSVVTKINVAVVPVKNMHQVEVVWLLPPLIHEYR